MLYTNDLKGDCQDNFTSIQTSQNTTKQNTKQFQKNPDIFLYTRTKKRRRTFYEYAQRLYIRTNKGPSGADQGCFIPDP
jgi:hypothetical protein